MRMNRCKEILNNAIHMKPSLGKFIGDAARLTDKLLELCNKSVTFEFLIITIIALLTKLRLSRLVLYFMDYN